MSESPKAIFAILHDPEYPEDGGEWLSSDSFEDGYVPTKYVRADIVTELVTALEELTKDYAALVDGYQGQWAGHDLVVIRASAAIAKAKGQTP